MVVYTLLDTFVESIFAYLGYTVWNDNACQFIATFECLFLNYGRSLGNDSNTVFYFVFCHRSVSRLPVHREVLCYYSIDFSSIFVRRRIRAYLSPSTRPSRKAR